MRITELACRTALLLPLLLPACAGDKLQHYPGPPRPQEQVAVIEGADRFIVFGAYGVDLISVDGSKVGDGSVQVLPGKHTVGVEA